MTIWYSDHLGTDGIADASLASPSRLPNAAIVSSRLRVKRMTVSFAGASPTPAAADVVRFGTMKLTDRIYEIWANVETVMGSAATMLLGVHETGVRHDGAVADADLFATGIDINTAARADAFLPGALEDGDRGKELRTLLDEGRGDTVYTTQRGDIQVDITGTLAGTTAAAGVVTIEVWYTAGD